MRNVGSYFTRTTLSITVDDKVLVQNWGEKSEAQCRQGVRLPSDGIEALPFFVDVERGVLVSKVVDAWLSKYFSASM